MEYQEYKIVNIDTGSEVFFVSRAFKSAWQDAQEYLKRNEGKRRMMLYRQSTKPRPFPRWELISCNPRN